MNLFWFKLLEIILEIGYTLQDKEISNAIKTYNVIKSCVTLEQVKGAEKFFYLYIENNTDYVASRIRYILELHLEEKQREIFQKYLNDKVKFK